MSMNLSRIKRTAKGVYLISDSPDSQNEWCLEVVGPLSNAFKVLEEAINDHPSAKLYYLKFCQKIGAIGWVTVNMEYYHHYTGPQCELLHHYLYITNKQNSLNGWHQLAEIFDVSSERVRDAFRNPKSSKYIPFSVDAFIYIMYKFQRSEFGHLVNPKYHIYNNS